MAAPIELRQLRYFVAVAEELHFGRAAERLHMSQSPLSRAIRELERDLGVVLFVRTTRRVELTEAGALLLEHSRRALGEVDAAIADAQRAARADSDVVGIGYGPFSRPPVTRIADELSAELPELVVHLVEDVSAESLRRVGAHELAAAVVLETPGAARRYGVRIESLRDEPLLAALPPTHACATADAIPVAAFAAERVLLPREPPGEAFNVWLRMAFGARGVELGRTVKTLSAPWDRRMLPVASGEAVSIVVAEWLNEPTIGFAAVPFDPPLNFPMDLVSCWPATEPVEALLRVARSLRDAEGWLSERAVRAELPGD